MKKNHVAIIIFIVIISIFLSYGCKPGSENDTGSAIENTESKAKISEPEKTSTSAIEEEIKKPLTGTLNIQVWEGYLPEEVISLFEEETGIKLSITLVADNGTMITYLEGGGKSDLIMPTQNQVNRLYEQNLAMALDMAQIPNYKNVGASFKNQPWSMWNGSTLGSGNTYVIPYVFGTSGIVINTDKYKESLDNIGWEVLFDKDLKDRVSSRNSAESIMICMDLEKISRTELLDDTEPTLKRIKPKVLELKNNVLKFYSTGAEIMDLLKNEEVWVSHIWDGGGRNLMVSNPKFKYTLPATGGLGWTDTFMIPSSAQNIEGAYNFIDFLLRDDIAALVTENGNMTTVSNALKLADIENRELFVYSQKQLDELVWQLNFPQRVIDAYTSFWEEISLL